MAGEFWDIDYMNPNDDPWIHELDRIQRELIITTYKDVEDPGAVASAILPNVSTRVLLYYAHWGLIRDVIRTRREWEEIQRALGRPKLDAVPQIV